MTTLADSIASPEAILTILGAVLLLLAIVGRIESQNYFNVGLAKTKSRVFAGLIGVACIGISLALELAMRPVPAKPVITETTSTPILPTPTSPPIFPTPTSLPILPTPSSPPVIPTATPPPAAPNPAAAEPNPTPAEKPLTLYLVSMHNGSKIPMEFGLDTPIAAVLESFVEKVSGSLPPAPPGMPRSMTIIDVGVNDEWQKVPYYQKIDTIAFVSDHEGNKGPIPREQGQGTLRRFRIKDRSEFFLVVTLNQLVNQGVPVPPTTQ